MKSLKNCSNGEPGRHIGMSGPAAADFTSAVEEMLTTAGSSFAARSAKLSGAGRADCRRERRRATKRHGCRRCAGECRGPKQAGRREFHRCMSLFRFLRT